MDAMGHDPDRWRRDHPVTAAALLVAAGAGAAVLLAPWVRDDDIAKALYGAAITLVFAAFLGGLVKLLMDDMAALRERQENDKATLRKRQEDAAGFVTNVLADLKGVYDRVGRARIVILAHRSAKTYGDEMRDIIDARVQLRNVMRAVEQRADGVSPHVLKDVHDYASKMEGYLGQITGEFTIRYKEISDLQAAYETWATEARKAAATSDPQVRGKLAEKPADPWNALRALPRLAELVEGGAGWKDFFEEPLKGATGVLRAELATILGARPRETLWNREQGAAPEQARLAAS